MEYGLSLEWCKSVLLSQLIGRAGQENLVHS
jgi:hypothetical protein